MSSARLDRLSATGAAGAPRLEPGGTARLRFLRARQAEAPDPHDALYARAQTLDLPPAMVDAARAMADRIADDAAQAGRPLEGPPQTALLHLLVVMLVDVRTGSTRTPVLGPDGERHLRARLEPLVGYEAAPAALARIQAWVETAHPSGRGAAPGAPPSPLVRDGDSVATDRLFQLEARVVRAIAARLIGDVAGRGEVDAALDDVIARPIYRGGEAQRLSDEQARAVALAARSRLSVVSGGPGTGKTSIVIGVVRTLVRLGVAPGRVLLAAPTGKAAHRLSESLRRGLEQVGEPSAEDRALAEALPVAETLHRLLAYSPRTHRFARDRDDPLAADVVVVDEASMIDLRLMDALLEGLPDRAQLALLGDADQLPSVDAGAILRDLRQAPAVAPHAVTLTHSYRMDATDPRGAEILAAAQAIRRGAVPDRPVRARPGRLTHGGFELLQAEETEARRRFFDAWVARHLAPRSYQRAARRIVLYRDGAFRAEDLRAIESLMARLNGFRLLAVTRTAALPTGADAINAAIHERLRALDPSPDMGPRAGEPVMMLRNDYERGLFNGDVGVVMNVAVDSQAAAPMVVFATAGGYEPFPQVLLQQDLTLAHAMTVHKAQGSEFDEVALILPDADVPILSREVLYTGLTRAKTSVVVVGPPALIARAAGRPVVRHSGLADGLQRRLAEPPSAGSRAETLEP